MKKVILAIVASLALVGCAGDNSDFIANSNAIVNETTVETNANCGLTANSARDEQTLYAAEIAYNTAADAYVRAIAIPATAQGRAVAQPYLVRAYDYLKLARQAQAAAQGCSLDNYSKLAQAFANKAKSLTAK